MVANKEFEALWLWNAIQLLRTSQNFCVPFHVLFWSPQWGTACLYYVLSVLLPLSQVPSTLPSLRGRSGVHCIYPKPMVWNEIRISILPDCNCIVAWLFTRLCWCFVMHMFCFINNHNHILLWNISYDAKYVKIKMEYATCCLVEEKLLWAIVSFYRRICTSPTGLGASAQTHVAPWTTSSLAAEGAIICFTFHIQHMLTSS